MIQQNPPDSNAVVQEVCVCEPPMLSNVYKHLRNRDMAAEEIVRIREETAALVHDLTFDLQRQIDAIKEREEAKVAEEITKYTKIAKVEEEIYRTGIASCVAAGVMAEGRYQLVNRTKVDHPINIDRFKSAYPQVFERAVTIKKTDAISALMDHFGIKKTQAETQIASVCDDVPSGPPSWELTMRKIE